MSFSIEKFVLLVLSIVSAWTMFHLRNARADYKGLLSRIDKNREDDSRARDKLHEKINQVYKNVDDKYARKGEIERLENKVEKLEARMDKRFDRIEDMLGDRLDKLIDNSFSNDA